MHNGQYDAFGVALELWPAANRFRSYLQPFETYLRLRPDGPRCAEARFRILEGRFRDSFVHAPLESANLADGQILASIRRAEEFLERHPEHSRGSEVAFILAVECVRVARRSSGPELRRSYASRARAILEPLLTGEAMTASAAKRLLDALPR